MRLRTLPRWAIVLLVAVPAFGIGIAVSAAASSTPSITFHACLKNGSLMNVRTHIHMCAKGEAAVSWNSAGPQGPRGPQGPGAITASGPFLTNCLPIQPSGCAYGKWGQVTIHLSAGTYMLNVSDNGSSWGIDWVSSFAASNSSVLSGSGMNGSVRDYQNPVLLSVGNGGDSVTATIAGQGGSTYFVTAVPTAKM